MNQTQTTAIPKLYIGIDIHKKQWSVHLGTDICDHRGFSMPPDPEKLFQYVQLHFSDHEVAVALSKMKRLQNMGGDHLKYVESHRQAGGFSLFL